MRLLPLLFLPLLACTDVKISHVPVDADSDGFDSTVDCDDEHASVNPDADEACDDVDNDCDNSVDEDPVDGATWYADADADEHGDAATFVLACTAPDGSVASSDDCDDADASVHPEATEVCNTVDDDCDSEVDEDAVDAPEWYVDGDADGYGAGAPLAVCEAPAGYAATATDCDDTDPARHPGAPEPDCTDPTDYDCDGLVAWADDDLDGVAACEDCDDDDPRRSPLQVEVCDADDVDEDCDDLADDDDPDATGASTWYVDSDGDLWGSASTQDACDQPAGHVAATGDCDDVDAAVSPDAIETCNGIDDDCDTSTDEGFDADGDALADCFDTERCDGFDNDGDGLVDDDDPDVTGASTWYADTDGDTFGDPGVLTTSCTAPPSTVADAADCDDSDDAVFPGAPEVCDDGVDSDCDGGDAAPCRYSGTYALEGTTDAAVKLYGEASLDQYGYGLAAGMDLDADGSSDLVVGAWGYDDGARYGAAYVYTGGLPAGTSRADSDADAIVSGTTNSTYAYAADLFPVPDIDADGHDEWAAVHYNASPAATAVYLYEGEATTGAMVSDADALVIATGTGAYPAGNFSGTDGGWWLTNSWDTSYQGAATLYTGATPGDRIEGEADDDLAGTWLAGGDDYDGDGVSDVAIGAPRHEGGVVYIVLGPSSGDLSLAAADSRIDTSGAADDFGRDLDAIGDIDGDGLADLMAGAPEASGAGAVYVFTGVNPARARPDDSVSDAIIVLQGDSGEQLAGVENQSVSAVGDVDLDGELDFLVSSAHATVGAAADAGRAWLLYGPRGGTVDVSVEADATFDGDDDSDGCGSDGALIDLDADGWLDIVLGCTRGDEGTDADVGAVYVYYGG